MREKPMGQAESSMTETDWKIGDEVVIVSNYGRRLNGPYKITTVSMRQLTVSNGSKWTNARSPGPWGSSRDRFISSHLRRVDDAALQTIAMQKREARARRLADLIVRDRERITDAQLDAIEQALTQNDG
jgi:hypothetical protein